MAEIDYFASLPYSERIDFDSSVVDSSMIHQAFAVVAVVAVVGSGLASGLVVYPYLGAFHFDLELDSFVQAYHFDVGSWLKNKLRTQFPTKNKKK